MRWLTLSLEATISVSEPSVQPIYRNKCGNIGWNMKQVPLPLCWKGIFNTWRSKTQKRQKLLSEMHHKSYSSPELQWRSSWQKPACFSPSQTFVKCFTCRLMCADTTKCAHFHIRKGIFDWKHALEGLRSHEHLMEHIVDATITFSCRCNNHYEELIQN